MDNNDLTKSGCHPPMNGKSGASPLKISTTASSPVIISERSLIKKKHSKMKELKYLVQTGVSGSFPPVGRDRWDAMEGPAGTSKWAVYPVCEDCMVATWHERSPVANHRRYLLILEIWNVTLLGTHQQGSGSESNMDSTWICSILEIKFGSLIKAHCKLHHLNFLIINYAIVFTKRLIQAIWMYIEFIGRHKT